MFTDLALYQLQWKHEVNIKLGNNKNLSVLFKGAVIYILASTLNACGAICSLKCLEICIRAELVLPLVGSIFRFLKREHEKEKNELLYL